jgi:tRNA A37 threonylcarbamoyladenosine modification protein TsaB
LDARRGEVYAALYDVAGTAPRPLVEPFCAPPGAAALRLATGLGSGGAIVGSGAALVLPHAPVPLVALGDPAVPVAQALLELVRAGACQRVAPQDVEPLYLRKSDAEVRRDTSLRSEA